PFHGVEAALGVVPPGEIGLEEVLVVERPLARAEINAQAPGADAITAQPRLPPRLRRRRQRELRAQPRRLAALAIIEMVRQPEALALRGEVRAELLGIEARHAPDGALAREQACPHGVNLRAQRCNPSHPRYDDASITRTHWTAPWPPAPTAPDPT